MIRCFGVIVLTVFLLSSCGGDSQDIAVVNGKKITKNDFSYFLKFKRINESDEKKTERVLEQYLEREGLASVIEKEDFLDNGLMKTEFNEFKKEMLISRYFEKYLKEVVNDQAVKNYYSTHAGEFEQKKVHVAHILIRTNKKMGETERKAKLTTAQEAYSKLRTGKDFGEIAKDYSEDKISAKKGGDLGWLKEGSISPVFSKTVFNLEKDKYSEPFETSFGFHIVKVVDAPKTIKQPFKKVEGNIRYRLRNKAKKAENERLMAKAKIKKNENK